MATHEEWINAQSERDRHAREAVRHLLAGDTKSALICARAWDTADDEMLRIARAIDSNPRAYDVPG